MGRARGSQEARLCLPLPGLCQEGWAHSQRPRADGPTPRVQGIAFTQLSKAGPGAGLADTIFSTKPATRVNREAHRSGSMPLCSRTSQLYSEAQDGFCGSDIWTGHSGGASLCSAKTQTAVNSQNGQELECSRRFLPHIWHQSPNDSRGGLSQPADQCQHVALLCDPGSHTACWVPGAVST